MCSIRILGTGSWNYRQTGLDLMPHLRPLNPGTICIVFDSDNRDWLMELSSDWMKLGLMSHPSNPDNRNPPEHNPEVILASGNGDWLLELSSDWMSLDRMPHPSNPGNRNL